MPAPDYLSRITEIISQIRRSQKENIDKAADAFARSITDGGRVYMFGSGHSVIPVLDVFPALWELRGVLSYLRSAPHVV